MQEYIINFKAQRRVMANNANEAISRFKPMETLIEIDEVFPSE